MARRACVCECVYACVCARVCTRVSALVCVSVHPSRRDGDIRQKCSGSLERERLGTSVKQHIQGEKGFASFYLSVSLFCTLFLSLPFNPFETRESFLFICGFAVQMLYRHAVTLPAVNTCVCVCVLESGELCMGV